MTKIERFMWAMTGNRRIMPGQRIPTSAEEMRCHMRAMGLYKEQTSSPTGEAVVAPKDGRVVDTTDAHDCPPADYGDDYLSPEQRDGLG